MYIIKYSKIASIELGWIYSYIAEDNNYFAIKVVQHIFKTIKYLNDFPFMWKPFWSYRELIETKYKFRIIYKIDEKQKVIQIISIFKNKNTF